MRPFGQELSLCERYYQKSYPYSVLPGAASSLGIEDIQIGTPTTGVIGKSVRFPVKMRSNPTCTMYDLNGVAGACYRGANNKPATVSFISPGGFVGNTTDPTSAIEMAFQWKADARL
jgi:hypothetical protein